MKNFGKLLMAGALAVTFGIPGAMAATNGTLGADSTGTADISLSIAQQYQISGLADFVLGAYDGTGDLTGNTNLCVYTNDADADYQVIITDSTASDGFTVSNGGSGNIAYAVDWNSAPTTTNTAPVTHGTPMAGTDANTSSVTCDSGADNSANLRITFAESDLQAAASGSYTATLSVLIQP